MTTAIMTQIRYALPMTRRRLDTRTDEELLERIAERDETAFSVFCRRYLQWAFRFDMRFLQNQQDAEDAVQEKFLRIWQKAGDFHPLAGSRVTNYLLKIDKNICLDMIRRSYRKREISPEDTSGSPEMQETALLDYLAYCHGGSEGDSAAETQHEAGELAERIIEFTRTRFKRKQFLVFWGFVSGMSYREIASTYDLSVGSVRGYVARSFASIRDVFSEARTGHE
ncbi:MAG TPA: sigma-70 family RNA polymerase sigma factor [bacterium]|nr:sigma-70 family RNA polymerase sigma factor [bacterium]